MSLRFNMNAVLFGAVLVVGLHGSAANAQMSHEGHAGMGHSMPPPAAAAPAGKMIRESTVEGGSMQYRLYSWDERKVMMKGMEGHAMPGMDTTGKATNHIMVFVKGPDGKEFSGGKVGFIVVGPDKAEQKTLTMSMIGGYGADVTMKAKGAYTIETKAVFGDKTLKDKFTYTVE